eukprot:134559-Chlamydomonas_euryale.AAC.2
MGTDPAPSSYRRGEWVQGPSSYQMGGWVQGPWARNGWVGPTHWNGPWAPGKGSVIRTGKWMDGWVNGQAGGQMDWMDGWVHGRVHGWVHGWAHGQTDRR